MNTTQGNLFHTISVMNFGANGEKELNKKVNEFLEKNPYYELVDIKYSVAFHDGDSEEYFPLYGALVIYKKN